MQNNKDSFKALKVQFGMSIWHSKNSTKAEALYNLNAHLCVCAV